MSYTIADIDQVAASLAKMYQQNSEFCLIVRTDRKGKASCRIIGPGVDVVLMSEFLHQCADALFNGPITTERPKSN